MTPAAAAAELLKRRQARGSLLDWCNVALEPYRQKPARHHALLIEQLDAVARGECRKLMVLMPPGSGKSVYGSYLFPPWLMARAGTQVLAASHSITRAEYVSRQAQRYVRDNAGLLGFQLEKEAAGLWTCSNGSEYRAAGVGEGIAGSRASIGLIDDPVRSRADADSETQREHVWDWYWGDFVNRLKPGSPQVLIMTRWHEADLGGRLEETEGNEWRIIRLPAIAEADDPLGRAPGDFLWSDDDYGFSNKLREDFAAYSRAGRARDWAALFQQRPTPDAGLYFSKDWLRPVPTLPPRSSLRVFGASDYAVTADGGDYTVHIVLGVDSDDRLYVLDLWRDQASSERWVEAFCDLVVQWKPLGWAEETGQIRAGIGPWLDRRSRERRAFVARTPFPTRGDKAVRAQSIRGRMALNGLYIPTSAPWRAELEAELLSFPAGKHDDQVDALGLVGQLLDVMLPPPKPAKERPPEDTWSRAFNKSYDEDAESSWKVA